MLQKKKNEGVKKVAVCMVRHESGFMISASDSFSTMALYKSTYLLTYQA